MLDYKPAREEQHKTKMVKTNFSVRDLLRKGVVGRPIARPIPQRPRPQQPKWLPPNQRPRPKPRPTFKPLPAPIKPTRVKRTLPTTLKPRMVGAIPLRAKVQTRMKGTGAFLGVRPIPKPASYGRVGGMKTMGFSAGASKKPMKFKSTSDILGITKLKELLKKIPR